MTRLTRRLLFGAVAVLVPALAGCEAGLDAPTLTYHSASSGVTVTENGIGIDNAFVLGSGLSSALPAGGRAGVFLALDAPNGDRLLSVSAPVAATSATLTGGPVDLPPNALVNLDGPTPRIVLTGLTNPLSSGQTIQLVLNFATAGSVALEVPVEPRAYDYATYSPPAIPTPKASAASKTRKSATASASPSATP